MRMSNIKRLSVEEFTTGSLESGYVKTKYEAWKVLTDKAGQSFMNKLNEQKVKIGADENYGALYISEKNDAIAVSFRGHWFELYTNYELLDAGVDSFVFCALTDHERIKVYQKFDKTKKDTRPAKQQYAPQEDELMTLWQMREAKNKGLLN